ncbi:MAG TPA: MucB/RseB C-terminal domain-containing protein [Rhodocyclaceae bacterium]|nr:MucB/RseB C-terminal domain-containing protein [Rhodocyclaceae bacterium]
MIGSLFILCDNAQAEVNPDALQWMQKSAAATRKLSYSGTFIYQTGGRMETSHIVHYFDGNHEFERAVVLDGSPREIVRTNDEVRCYLPESRVVVVEKRGLRRGLPVTLPEGIAGLTDFYNIRRGPPARVAGFETQSILAEPRDTLRYHRQFWLDTHSGLVLKASMVNDRGEVRESFAFTELKIGGSIDKEALKPQTKIQGADWRVHDAQAREVDADDTPWVFTTLLPGYKRISSMKRQVHADGTEAIHVVFSDGLSAISAFIEPLTPARSHPELGTFSMGAVNGYKRQIGNNLVVVMGDAPVAAIRKLADGVEMRHK